MSAMQPKPRPATTRAATAPAIRPTTIHDSHEPGSSTSLPASGSDGERLGDHFVLNQRSMMSKTSSLPRSLKGSWYRPGSSCSSLCLWSAALCSSSLPAGSMSRSSVSGEDQKRNA